jgi:hypothetical protein
MPCGSFEMMPILRLPHSGQRGRVSNKIAAKAQTVKTAKTTHAIRFQSILPPTDRLRGGSCEPVLSASFSASFHHRYGLPGGHGHFNIHRQGKRKQHSAENEKRLLKQHRKMMALGDKLLVTRYGRSAKDEITA